MLCSISPGSQRRAIPIEHTGASVKNRGSSPLDRRPRRNVHLRFGTDLTNRDFRPAGLLRTGARRVGLPHVRAPKRHGSARRRLETAFLVAGHVCDTRDLSARMLGKERASLGTVYNPSPGAAILYEQKNPLCKSGSSTSRCVCRWRGGMLYIVRREPSAPRQRSC